MASSKEAKIGTFWCFVCSLPTCLEFNISLLSVSYSKIVLLILLEQTAGKNSTQYQAARDKVFDTRNTFIQLESVQETAYRALAFFGFIEKNLFFNDIISLTDKEIPNNLLMDLNDEEKNIWD
ncbi:MAG: hypothetical protein LIO85_00360 [Rikenellaceae bacterium]|nr:hypothetical protein [Rikenellaceae bacterium]MCC8173161.1 hypothetical protein [Odoribacter sp.]